MKHIELFAGCGGLSLGLEAAGFELYFANELSPMAAETFAFNIMNEDLQTEVNPTKSLWINSQYKKGDKKRLTENPFTAIKNKYNKNKDLIGQVDLNEKLLIGDINQLNKFVNRTAIKNNIRAEKIDLVSGGPPCQSFSLAGRREKNNKRNNLPWAFAEFVKTVKPKMVLLENVSGILRPFKEEGKEYHAWFEVAKAFCLSGYVPICIHINAKYFGLPQNRPRFIMLAIRYDLTKSLMKDKVLLRGIGLYRRVRRFGKDIKLSEKDGFFELNNNKDLENFKESIYLPKPKLESKFKSVEYGIDKLKYLQNEFNSTSLIGDEYFEILQASFEKATKDDFIVKNHNQRNHTTKIANRFKFLKLIEEFENGDKIKLIHALKIGSIIELNERLKEELVRKFKGISDNSELEKFVSEHRSKKHSQRALVKDRPAPATLSIPDDVCHYDLKLDRTLTVREMARIQSFPDWFEFRAKDTTGGTNRRFEVPNYTQVGNAVPPLLGKALGDWLRIILDEINHEV